MDSMEEGSRFAWAKGKTLTQEDFEIGDRCAYIEDFIFSGSITMIYSPPKQGKTWLGYAIATEVAKHEVLEELHYLDMDNSISTLKERNVHNTLLRIPKIFYHTRGTIGCDPIEQLDAIAAAAVRHAYEGVCFVLDTTKDFVDTDSKGQSTHFMKQCVRLRDAGATVIVLHHSTKNKKGISGQQVFINTPDNVYSLRQTGEMGGVINYELQVTHARGLVKDCKWSVDTATLRLSAYDAVASGMSEEERAAVQTAREALALTPDGMSMSRLIAAMGFGSRTDRRGKRLVRDLTGIYWRREERSRNNHIYHLIDKGEQDDRKTESLQGVTDTADTHKP